MEANTPPTTMDRTMPFDKKSRKMWLTPEAYMGLQTAAIRQATLRHAITLAENTVTNFERLSKCRGSINPDEALDLLRSIVARFADILEGGEEDE
jgi:hypothetical protein